MTDETFPNEAALAAYLAREHKAPAVAARIMAEVAMGEALARAHGAASLAALDVATLEAMADEMAAKQGDGAKTALWAWGYLFTSAGRADLATRAAALRQALLPQARPETSLAQLPGLSPDTLARLAAVGLADVAALRAAAAMPRQRAALAVQAGLPLAVIVEVTRLADLSRLSGVQGARARLFYEGGYPTLDALAAVDPQQVVDTLRDYVASSGWQGPAPWLSEATAAVNEARALPREVVW